MKQNKCHRCHRTGCTDEQYEISFDGLETPTEKIQRFRDQSTEHVKADAKAFQREVSHVKKLLNSYPKINKVSTYVCREID